MQDNTAKILEVETDRAAIERRRLECARHEALEQARAALAGGLAFEFVLETVCKTWGEVLDRESLLKVCQAARDMQDRQGAETGAPVERKLTPAQEFLELQKAAFAFLDARHSIMTLGCRAGILNEIPDASGWAPFALLGEKDFCLAYRHLQGFRPPEEGEKAGRRVQFARAWIERPETRRYWGMGFYPPPMSVPRGALNLWKGWPYQGKPVGSCKRFMDHVEQNLCGGDVRLFGWLVAWFADLVQNPGLPPKGTAIVLRGERGTGKTLAMDTFGRLFGPAYSLVSHPDEFLGRFNSGLETCLLLGCDEGTWGGDRKHESLLKSLITGERRQSERKFMDAAQVINRTRVLISSNNDWIIPAGEHERRFLVLDVKSDRRQDTQYFAAIKEELERDGGSGYAALFEFLRGFRIGKSCDLRKPPETQALGYQKMQSLDSFGSWWADCLYMGSIGAGCAWPVSLAVSDFYNYYLSAIRARGDRYSMSQVQAGRALARLCPGVERVRERGDNAARFWAYRLPVLGEARRQFEAALGSAGVIPWPEEGDFL